MKSSKAVVAMVGIAFVIAIGAMAGRTANAATPTVGLGTAANFSVLAGTEVTNTGPTTTDRNLGVHPGSSVTGFPPGIVGGSTHTGDGVAQAQSDLVIAYNGAAGRTPFSVVTGDLPVAPTAAPAAGVRSLPSTSTGDPGPLTILGTALAGIGCLLLVRRPVRHL